MTYQTVILSSIEACLSSGEYPSLEERAEEELSRNQRLSRFPYAVMLQLAFPELDFANRLCWQEFGPADGECTQRFSQYRVCQIDVPHSHSGVWADYWFVKTDYDFGFNEWYFADQSHYDLFLKYVPKINWGESYPK